MPLKIDHIGIAVLSLDPAIAEYKKLYAPKFSERETLFESKVELIFANFLNSSVELIAPLSPESVLSNFLKKRGPGLHHICYEVSDLKAELLRFESMGYELIDHIPRPGARGAKIAFIKPSKIDGTLIELCQY